MSMTLTLFSPTDRTVPAVVACPLLAPSSTLQAVFDLMHLCHLPFAQQVQVTCADGSVWRVYQLAAPCGPVSLLDPLAPSVARRYDVALWRRGVPGELPIVDESIMAYSPLLAALMLMHMRKVRFVSHVAVGCPDGSVWRRERLALYTDNASEDLREDTTREEEYAHE